MLRTDSAILINRDTPSLKLIPSQQQLCSECLREIWRFLWTLRVKEGENLMAFNGHQIGTFFTGKVQILLSQLLTFKSFCQKKDPQNFSFPVSFSLKTFDSSFILPFSSYIHCYISSLIPYYPGILLGPEFSSVIHSQAHEQFCLPVWIIISSSCESSGKGQLLP